MSKKRLVTGDRPTGALHLGHYLGSIANRVRLQEEYDCYFIIADWHVLTTRPEKSQIEEISPQVRSMLLDYLSCGIDPEKSTLYLQSAISEVAELALYLGMLVSVPRLQRIPSLKEMAQNASLSEMPLGLLSYPVLQAADILGLRASIVPVGKDNESHVELCREIARRVHFLYPQEREIFPLPEVLLSEHPTLIGTDGQKKMSKSAGNAIFLADDTNTVRKKVHSMYTDPKRTSAKIPGTIEGNPVFTYHDLFNKKKEEVDDLKERYQKGNVGDVEVKDKLASALNDYLEPFRQRRLRYEHQKKLIDEILYEGTLRARDEVKRTLQELKKSMGISKTWNGIRRRLEK